MGAVVFSLDMWEGEDLNVLNERLYNSWQLSIGQLTFSIAD